MFRYFDIGIFPEECSSFILGLCCCNRATTVSFRGAECACCRSYELKTRGTNHVARTGAEAVRFVPPYSSVCPQSSNTLSHFTCKYNRNQSSRISEITDCWFKCGPKSCLSYSAIYLSKFVVYIFVTVTVWVELWLFQTNMSHLKKSKSTLLITR